MHTGSFRVSLIHQTLTWTTGSLTCVRDHSYVRTYTRSLGTPTTSQHNIFDSEKLSQIFLVLPTGLSLQVIGSRVRRSTNWATPRMEWLRYTSVHHPHHSSSISCVEFGKAPHRSPRKYCNQVSILPVDIERARTVPVRVLSQNQVRSLVPLLQTKWMVF